MRLSSSLAKSAKSQADNFVSFKSKGLEQEWETLRQKNLGLYSLIENVAYFTKEKMKKGVVITMIYRTEQQQKALYSARKTPPKTSYHMDWKAVDLRSKTFTADETEDICNYLNKHYNGFNKCVLKSGKICTALYHKIENNGFHFHVQYNGPVIGRPFQYDSLPSPLKYNPSDADKVAFEAIA